MSLTPAPAVPLCPSIRRVLAAARAPTRLIVVVLLFGCVGVGDLPQIDPYEPGWTMWSGQALWVPRQGQPALAGELLVAQHANGDVLVSLSKPPVPLFTAQAADRRWRIDFAEAGRSYSGRGRPPERFVWFQIPAILHGAPPPKPWQVSANSDRGLVLNQPQTGEAIRLVLDP